MAWYMVSIFHIYPQNTHIMSGVYIVGISADIPRIWSQYTPSLDSRPVCSHAPITRARRSVLWERLEHHVMILADAPKWGFVLGILSLEILKKSTSGYPEVTPLRSIFCTDLTALKGGQIKWMSHLGWDIPLFTTKSKCTTVGCPTLFFCGISHPLQVRPKNC